MEKKIVVTGGAGFVGANTVQYLSTKDLQIYAVVRPGSAHNNRIAHLENVHPIELDKEDLINIPRFIKQADYFFHFLWRAHRNDREESQKNVTYTLNAVKVAAELGCKRILITGSQAEYGATSDIQLEDSATNPFDEYGKAKVEACLQSQELAERLGVEWVWGRIFSLIGRYEPDCRLYPHMVNVMKQNGDLHLSSCMQNWDYLDVKDAAKAIYRLALYGHSGEIYNIANGNYRPLKCFVQETKKILNSKSCIHFGDSPQPFVSLQPSIEKIIRDVGWKPMISYEESVYESLNSKNSNTDT